MQPVPGGEGLFKVIHMAGVLRPDDFAAYFEGRITVFLDLDYESVRFCLVQALFYQAGRQIL